MVIEYNFSNDSFDGKCKNLQKLPYIFALVLTIAEM